MLHLAWRTLRVRKGSFVAAFVVLMCASALIAASGVLAESGLRSTGEPYRYMQADAVVIADQSFTPDGGNFTTTTRLAESPSLPTGLIETIQALPEVETAIGDNDLDLMLGTHTSAEPIPVEGHGWDTSTFGSYTLARGDAPSSPGEIVLTESISARFGVTPGDAITVYHQAMPHDYRVTGIVADPLDSVENTDLVFLYDADAHLFAPSPDRVSTIAVIAADQVSDREVTEALEQATAQDGAEVLTGASISRAEHVELEQGRGLLLLVAASFGGFAVLISLFMVAGTLALALNARRREFAVLRAMGATSGQVLSMVGAEALLLAGLASTLGALPGFALAEGMRRVFARVGVMPESLALSFSPIPVLVAVALTVLTAWLGVIAVASGPAHIRPVEAMRGASREPRQSAGWRTIVGLICAALGLGAALIPIGLRSDAGTAGTSSAALLLVIGLALAGPSVLRPLVTVVTRPLRRLGVSGFLAAENSEAQVRRLGGVLMPLLLAIGFTLPMVYSQTILAQAVTNQIEEGITSDVVIADTGSGGIDPDVLATIQSLPETGTVTAVQDTQILLPYSIFGDTDITQTTARGITVDGIATTLDPDVTSGDLSDLTGSTIALDRSTARIISAQVGDDIDVVLGDGTSRTLTVVAIYDRDLGLGGAILPSKMLDGHAAAPTQTLISADESATSDALHAALTDLLARYPTLTIANQETFADQSRSEATMASWVNLTGLVVIVAFISIIVVNNLVMATLERAREFALLRLIGTTRAQIRRMLCYEALVITVLAIVLGSFIAAIPLIVLSLAFLGSPLPAASPWVYIGVIAVAAVLALTSVLTSAARVLRQPTTSTIGVRE